MGGDSQPSSSCSCWPGLWAPAGPGRALDAGRWLLGGGSFDTWEGAPRLDPGRVARQRRVGRGPPAPWPDVQRSAEAIDLSFGQAHMIGVDADGVLDGADPRAAAGAAAGY